MGALAQRKQIRLALEQYRDPNAIASLTMAVRDRRPIFRDERLARLMVGVIEAAAHDTATPVYAYTVMPDHVHLLIGAGIKPAPTMLRGDVGADFTSARDTWSIIQFVKFVKGRSVAAARRDGLISASFWQRSFYDHFFRKDEDVEVVCRYVWNNAVRAGIVRDWHDYPYNGSTVYDLARM